MTTRAPIDLLSGGLLLVGLQLGGFLLGGAGATTAVPPSAVAPPADEISPAVPTPFLRVLGTAQDGGIPHAACEGPNCRAARHDPERERLIASLAIVLPASDEVHLIDLTPDIRRQLDRLRDVRRPPEDGVDRSPIDGAFLTHAHIGHYLGLAFFGFEAVHTRELPLRVSPRMAGYLEASGPWSQLVELRNVRLDVLEPGVSIELGDGVRVTGLPVPHRDELSDTLAFRIEGPRRSVLYLPDCDPWHAWTHPPEEILRGIDLALLDGTFYSGDELPDRRLEEIGHPLVVDSMDRFEELVRGGGLEIRFTHMNHSNPLLDPATAARREVARRGFRVLEELEEIGL